jgi:hypothetical protein
MRFRRWDVRRYTEVISPPEDATKSTLTMTHNIFLSYSRRDNDIMQQVRDRLRAAGFSVWTDEGIETGTRSWKRAIEDAILNADCLVCLLSPDANQSEWVHAEIDFAELHGKKIYPVLARGDQRSAIPFGFATTQWIDLRSSPPSDTFNQQIGKLISAIRDQNPADSIVVEATVESVQPAAEAPEIKVRPPSLIANIQLSEKAQKALNTINSLTASPLERVQAGNDLNSPMDPRRGVGIRMDGIPDIDWIKVPAGDFIYQNGQTASLPAYFIARYPVTYVQYQSFIDDPSGYAQDRWWQGLAVRQKTPAEQTFKIANHPRETVSWYDAVAFCRWLSHRVNYEIRLPSDQEWEKAARGTDGRQYPWGDEYISGYANCNEVTDSSGGFFMFQTSPVGVYTQGASPYGVLDMGGNVWEWCTSLFDDPDDVSLDEGGQRVLRGGSWHNPPKSTSAVYRTAGDADGRSGSVGFRVARSANNA